MNRITAVYPRLGLRPCDDRFTYTPTAGWRPVQRLLFWLLHKIGANLLESVVVERIVHDAEKLSVALLYKHRVEVDRLMYEPSRVLMGPKEWHELMAETVTSAVRFIAPVDLRKGSIRIVDLDVTIVPWMRGLLVLPKELL